MKRFLSVAFAVLMIAGLSSCKKDWTCDCTVAGQTLSVPLQKQTKGQAKDNCDAAETTYKSADPNASCELN